MGHYYSFVRDCSSEPDDPRWFQFNDHKTSFFYPEDEREGLDNYCFGGKEWKEVTRSTSSWEKTTKQIEKDNNAFMLGYSASKRSEQSQVYTNAKSICTVEDTKKYQLGDSHSELNANLNGKLLHRKHGIINRQITKEGDQYRADCIDNDSEAFQSNRKRIMQVAMLISNNSSSSTRQQQLIKDIQKMKGLVLQGDIDFVHDTIS